MARLQTGALTLILMTACSFVPPKDEFFPAGAVNELEVDWYAEQLIALGQRPIPPLASDNRQHVYRFTWLRTFHNPIAIVLKVENGGASALSYHEASGAGGYDPGSISATERRRLSKAETQSFLQALENADFWSMQPEENLPHTGPDGKESVTIQIDCSQWIVEGVRAGQYHLVDRFCPSEGAYRDAALLLLQLSRRTVEPVY